MTCAVRRRRAAVVCGLVATVVMSTGCGSATQGASRQPGRLQQPGSARPSAAAVSDAPSGASPAFLTVDGRDFRLGGVGGVRLRGVNFNNEPALSCCGGPDLGALDVGPAEYAQVGAWGGNVIRFGLDYAWYATDRGRFLSILDAHVHLAQANRLWMIPVLFIPPGGGSGGFKQNCLWRDCRDAAANQGRLVSFWRDLGAHLAGQPTIAGYDLLNEPAPPTDAEWYGLAQRLHDAVGAVDAHHFVVVESTESGRFSTALRGSNLVYSDHQYAPLSYTLGREPDARRACPAYPGSCEGRWWDRASMARYIRDGEFLDIDFSVRHRVPVLVGEFGAEKSSGHARWVADEEEIFEELGLHWIMFVIREPGDGFGLYTCGGAGDLSCPDQALIAVQRQHMAGSIRP
jgi:hypothetical protein